MILVQANALMAPLPDKSVQCVVTSPPYWGMRDYGLEEAGIGLEETPEAYIENMVAVGREIWRVLRDDGVFFMNLGDSYAGSPAGNKGERRIGDGGQIFKNKPFDSSKGTGLKPKDLCGIPWRVALALQADGWYLRSDIIWHKPNPMPESVTDRPTKAHEYVFLLTKRARYFYDADAVREKVLTESLKRAEYSGANDTKWHKSRGVRGGGVNDRACLAHGPNNNPAGRNRRTVWTIATQPYSGAHFATFPEKLVEPMIKAGCPVGGVVLDPFVGSGTTGIVARRLERKFVGLDLSAEYLQLAQQRSQIEALTNWNAGDGLKDDNDYGDLFSVLPNNE